MSCAVHAKAKSGRKIQNVDDWKNLAGPKGGDSQWKPYRSAMELALSWFRDGTAAMPTEYSTLLGSCPLTEHFRPEVAFPEVEIKFDQFGGPRNSDMIVIGEAKKMRVLLAVEAKADEPFANTVGVEVKKGLKRSKMSGMPKRAEQLAMAVLHRRYDEQVKQLRYQLLNGLAATAVAAKKHKAKF